FIDTIHILPNNKNLSSPSYHEGAKRLFIAVPPFFIVQYRTQFLLNRVYHTLASEPNIVQPSSSKGLFIQILYHLTPTVGSLKFNELNKLSFSSSFFRLKLFYFIIAKSVYLSNLFCIYCRFIFYFTFAPSVFSKCLSAHSCPV